MFVKIVLSVLCQKCFASELVNDVACQPGGRSARLARQEAYHWPLSARVSCQQGGACQPGGPVSRLACQPGVACQPGWPVSHGGLSADWPVIQGGLSDRVACLPGVRDQGVRGRQWAVI